MDGVVEEELARASGRTLPVRGARTVGSLREVCVELWEGIDGVLMENW